jgi:hypothetical protein
MVARAGVKEVKRRRQEDQEIKTSLAKEVNNLCNENYILEERN